MDTQKLVTVFGSKTKAQEIIFLLENVKPVVRQGFYPSELSAVTAFCQEQNFVCVTSSFKVLLDDLEAYTNKGLRIPQSDPRPGMIFVYISWDESLAYQAAYAEVTGNDEELGLLLGYPRCCVDYFCENFSTNHTNPEIPSSNPFTRLSQRKNDCVLLSHFPCRADCQKSIALAKKYLGVIQKNTPERAEEMWKILTLSTSSPRDNGPIP